MLRENPLWPAPEKRPCSNGSCGAETAGQRHYGHCVHCGHHIGAQTSKAWSRKVKQPCPHCGRPW